MTHLDMLLKSFNTTSVKFIDDIIAWKIEPSQISSFIDEAGNNFELTKNLPFRDPIYYWHEIDLGLVVTALGIGLVFESIEEAKRIIPKLRPQGFTIEEASWALSLNEEDSHILNDSNWQKYPSENFNVFANEKTGNLMSRIDVNSALWFQKEKHFQFHEEMFKQMEAML